MFSLFLILSVFFFGLLPVLLAPKKGVIYRYSKLVNKILQLQGVKCEKLKILASYSIGENCRE